MKLHVKWFSLTTLILFTVPSAVLFIWASINGFGIEMVRLFESLHPSGGLSILSNIERGFVACIPGIFINIFYAAVDSFISGFAFSSLYNFLITRYEK